MARMASRPRIGAIIRDAMERKRLDQIRLARMTGISRSAINAYINDRSWPEGWRIVAVEEALGIELPRWADSPAPNGDRPEPPSDPRERRIWDLAIQDMDPEAAWEVIAEYRRRRRRIA
jgi:transcriptional regulator with XRE-family HTH domain